MIRGMGQTPRMAFDKLRLSGVPAEFNTTPAHTELVEARTQSKGLIP